ncbi:MAG: T9SS type A sorting domain-containing protein [Bacteroidia bacterium]
MIFFLLLPSFSIATPPSQVFFEKNLGQFEPSIRFQSRVGDVQFRFLADGVSYAMTREVEKTREKPLALYQNYQWAGSHESEYEALVWNIRFAGISPKATLAGSDQISGEIHYLLGNNPDLWINNIHRFGEIWYQSVYEGIDLRYYGTEKNQIKYDFIIHPYAQIDQIQLLPEGIISWDTGASGECVFHTEWGTVADAAPVAWQQINGKIQAVGVNYKQMPDGSIGFTTDENYDPSAVLIIDPLTLTWSTFLHASTSDDYVFAVDRDADNYVYLTGYTKSTAFPITPGVYQGIYAGAIDGFITKMDPNGTALVFSTYIGGSDWELPYAIAVTGSKEPIIAGFMNSGNYPVTPGALQISSGGGLSEGFVTRLTSDGSGVVYSSYFGGADRDYIYDMVINAAGEAYLTGYTLSNNFPLTSGAYCSTPGGLGDIFVARVNAAGTGLVYSTLVAGTSYDIANTIAVNSAGDAFVGGNTGSDNLPSTPGTFQTSPNYPGPGTPEDAFVFRLSADGSGLQYFTYLGGTDSDVIYSLDINSNDEVFAAGVTFSPNFPATSGAYQTSPSPGFGMGDLFAVRLNNTGSSLLYSTYLGGSDVDFCKSVRINEYNEAHILGATRSADYPVTAGSASYNAMYDVSVSVLDAAGKNLLHSALWGGSYNEYPRASGGIHLQGDKLTLALTTHSPNMPITAGAFQGTKLNGTSDAPWIATVEVGTVLPLISGNPVALWRENAGLVRIDWEGSPYLRAGDYYVERKTETGFWTEIGVVSTKSGDAGALWWEDRQAIRYRGEEIYYRITVVSEDGSRYSSGITQVKIPQNQDLQISVSPNPVADVLKITARFPSGHPAQMEITSANGQTLYRTTGITSDVGRQLDISAWSPGIYYVSLKVNGFLPAVEKLMVK